MLFIDKGGGLLSVDEAIAKRDDIVAQLDDASARRVALDLQLKSFQDQLAVNIHSFSLFNCSQ